MLKWWGTDCTICSVISARYKLIPSHCFQFCYAENIHYLSDSAFYRLQNSLKPSLIKIPEAEWVGKGGDGWLNNRWIKVIYLAGGKSKQTYELQQR